MKILSLFLTAMLTAIAVATLSSCHDAPDYTDNATGNFDALWNILDSHYCFFEEKDIDWEAVGRKYRAEINPETNYIELFDICSRMLDELKDGHVNLSSSFNTSYYRRWWSDYPQDFNFRTLQQYYLGFDYQTTSGIIYKKLSDKVGYMYYPSFSSGISQTSLDYVLAWLYDCNVLIIDIRDNGGGLLTNIDVLVGRLITREISGGFIRHKTGPGPNDFSEPFEIRYKPAEESRVKWLKPVIVLTNRSCFSSANDFVATVKGLDSIWIVGAKTGGGGGLPFSSELPNGWGVRFSACPITDRNGRSTEYGIAPDEGCEVHATAEELAQGHDAILDFAIRKAESISSASSESVPSSAKFGR